MKKYKYTKTWFIGSEINKNILKHVNQNDINKVLEIGCFEGLSSVFFADNLLNEKNSFLICVDPFYKSNTVKGVSTQHVDENTKSTFLQNISKSVNYSKINFHNVTSDDFFEKNNLKFNFIYIDGCHALDYIKRDMENSFNFLEKNGIMWMDDYRGGKNGNIKKTMDNFLTEYNGKFIIIHKGYQLAIKKL